MLLININNIVENIERRILMKKHIWIAGIMLVLFLCTWNVRGEVSQNVTEESIEEKNTAKHTYILHADYPVYDSADKLVEAADLVFTGEVKDVTYEMLNVDTETNVSENGLMPYTIFNIEVSTVYKGEIIEKNICMKRLGGSFDTGIYKLYGASEIEVGKEYLFAASTYENAYASFLNPEQASYDLSAPDELSEEDNGITVSQILDIFDGKEN